VRHGAARIVDANLNRCREGLRCAEEYARFVLCDRGRAGALRAIRHDLAAAAGRLFSAQELSAGRGASGDILAAEPAAPRGSPEAVAAAALARCSEALRAVEEYGGLLNPAAPAEFSRMRFRSYTVAQEMSGGPCVRRRRLAEAKLYVLLTGSLCRSGSVLETARLAAEGGADLFQYREKELDDAAFLANARSLAGLCASLGVLLVINDRPHIARLAGADGVHLGQGDLPAAEAREIMGPGMLLGRSTHSPEQAAAAVAEGADYIGVGPVFETRTKAHADAVGLDYVRHCAAGVDLPGFAIGSVNGDTVDRVLEAGARRLAICTAITMQDDVRAATGLFRRKLDALSGKPCERCDAVEEAE
jgi:thiamine-phosphate pyrophosphorylase